MRAIRQFAALFALAAASAAFAQAPADNDHTLQAMKDEMARAKSRAVRKSSVMRPIYAVGWRSRQPTRGREPVTHRRKKTGARGARRG